MPGLHPCLGCRACLGAWDCEKVSAYQLHQLESQRPAANYKRLPMAPRTGERKAQILQALAEMLQDPKGEKITTAALAARLDVSEAALYRHFASKAQMYEGLIGFIEESVFGLINKIGRAHV